MMKISINKFTGLFFLFGLALSSCSNSDELNYYKNVEQPTRIGFEEIQIELNVKGEPIYNILAIQGPYDDWNVSSPEDWVSLEKGTTNINGKEEHTVVVSATENIGYSRKGTATVTVTYLGKSYSESFNIVQETALEQPEIVISETLINFSADGGTTEINLETNQSEWSATTDAEWLILEQFGSTLKITASENTSFETRNAEITFEAGMEPFTARVSLSVNQAKPDSEENITINGVELILVKAGTYFRGAQSTDPTSPNYYAEAAGNQGPVHQVIITKDFYIGKFEVTQAQFENIMGYNPSATKIPDHPVEMVPWNIANEFTERLSSETGRQFRLPTEAEWEYAARGGHLSKGYIYSGSNNPRDVAYHFEAGGDQREKGVTVPVGSFAPNELGIFDMSGNVYEWVLDHLESYSSGTKTDPIGVGEKRILRGGSWYHNKLSQAVSYRGSNTDDFSRAYLGLRVIYIPE